MSEDAPQSDGQVPLVLALVMFAASFVVFLVVWYAAADVTNNTLILAGPVQVLNALISWAHNVLPRGAPKTVTMYDLVAQTLVIVATGFIVSVIVGVPIGVAMGMSRTVETVVDPWVSATYAIPIVALIPVLYFAIGGKFGIGSNFYGDVSMAFLLSVFTIIVNTHAGVKYVSSSLAEVGRSFGASQGQFITKIVLPASLPEVVAGMRIGIGRALLGAVLAQALLSKNGLGGMMLAFQGLFNTPYMMASVTLIAVIGICLLQAPKLLERRLFRWRNAEGMSRGRTS